MEVKSMNGHKMTSDSYKKLLEQNKLTVEQVAPKLRAYDFLAQSTEDDICRLVNSSAMNKILKAYTKQACKNAGLSDIQQGNVVNALQHLLDTKTAEEVIE